jgi:uncharacterized cupredoxin-like copper-binding protein
MDRERSTMVMVVLGACCAGLTAWLLASVVAGPAAGQVKAHRAASVTIVTVTAGKPGELGFKLSKSSLLPAGTITFKVTNKGATTHNFKICTSAVASSAKNSCTGKATPMLKPGQSASLTVTLTKKGKYEYLCAVPGHAVAGMKGLLGIGVKVAAVPDFNFQPQPSVGAAAGANPGATCANPATTTVTVNEFEFGFTLSQNPIPCGKVTFIQNNSGGIAHNFDIPSIALARGEIINPGQSTTNSFNITPGSYRYVCDVNGHDVAGMVGTLTVTGG